MGVWCEVFRPGTWNGKYFGPEVVDQVIEAFDANKGQLQVPLRVGDHETLRPAGGWVTGLKKVGDRLMAELSDVVPAVGQAINKRMFKQVSIGLWRNHKDESGKTWPWVLNHIALLGGVLPAVRGLDDIPALFNGEGDREVITLDNEEYDDMDIALLKEQLSKTEAKLASAEGKNEQLASEVAGLKAKLADAEKAAEKAGADRKAELEAKDKEIKTLSGKIAEFDAAAAKAEVIELVATAVREGRLAPAVKDSTVSTGMALRGMEDFSKDDSPFAAWKKGLKDAPVVVDFAEKAKIEADADKGGEQLSEFDREMAEGAKIVATAKSE